MADIVDRVLEIADDYFVDPDLRPAKPKRVHGLRPVCGCGSWLCRICRNHRAEEAQ